MVAAAIGSDTAGSIQMPAALCGLTGFKPTARRVPLEGTVPLSTSLDSIGPLANSVACCATMDAVLAGESDDLATGIRISDLTFAVTQNLVLDDLDPQVAEAFGNALSRLSAAGARIVESPFSFLGQFPKIAFSVVEGYAWHRRLLAERQEDYDPIVARRFLAGAAISAADYIDLLNARRDLIRVAGQATRPFDAVLMPTVPIVAPALAAFKDNEDLWLATNRRLIRNPGIANFLDRCALSIPCHAPDGAPVGISMMGEQMEDRRVLAIGQAVEGVLQRGQ
jgi:aspartyl-tRNA(Asn)/glutamyl-tRNA(Gln) amidotransferase subunit A